MDGFYYIGSVLKMKNDLKQMLDIAIELESKGHLRRAMSLWQDIAVHPDTHEKIRNMAWDHLDDMNAQLAENTRIKKEKMHSTHLQRSLIRSDREKVIHYLRNGKSTEEICYLTRRSRAFIYECKRRTLPGQN